MKRNCWESKQCGREPGGAKAHEIGVCPAATETAADGIHGGRNGGRACWAVVGTFCGGRVQDTIVAKLHECVGCEFRHEVEAQEGTSLLTVPQITVRLS